MATDLQIAYAELRDDHGLGHIAAIKAIARRYPTLTADDVQNALDRASDFDRRGKPRTRDWQRRPKPSNHIS